MPHRILFATGVVVFLLIGCVSGNTTHFSQLPSSPVVTESHITASTPATKSEVNSFPEPPAEVFREGLPQLKQKAGVPILLPLKLPELAQPIYASSTGDRTSYTINLSSEPPTAQPMLVSLVTFKPSKGNSPVFNRLFLLQRIFRDFTTPSVVGLPVLLPRSHGLIRERSTKSS